MIFSSMPVRPRFLALGPAIAGLALAAALVVTAGCGGGTSQFEAFVPERYFAFGDDTSSLDANGRKQGVNGLALDGTIDCTLQPNWTQQMASSYGFVFAECNPSATTELRARMYARAGAKVADVAAQVDAQVAAGGFRDKDLSTVLVGANDVLELYAQYPNRSEASLMAEARARGDRVAQIVNRLVALGAKVVVSNVPDMGLSPFALAERAAYTDTNRAALLTRLTLAMNEQLGVKVLLDGRFVGLVQADLRWQSIDRSAASFGLVNSTTPVCSVAIPACTSATLVPADADPGLYLWADGTRLAPGGQTQLAQLAIDRARRNPF